MLKWSFLRPKTNIPAYYSRWSTWSRWIQSPSAALIPASLADTVERTTKPEYLGTANLGNEKSKLSYIFLHEWHQLQALLLHHEQVNLIRLIRTRLHKQQEVKADEFPSAVIPGTQWIVTIDSTSQSAAIRLSPVPQWTSSPAIGALWFLPLDGSKSWQFARVP